MDPLVYAILLYVAALLLLAIDIFVPSGGVLLFCGTILAIISVVFAFQSSINAGLIMLIVDLATIPIFAWIFMKVLPYTPIGRRLLLAPQENAEADEKDELKSLVGRVIINRWPLLPTGQVQLDHKRYNAQSFDGKPIEAGRRVKVLEVRERMLVVAETVEPLSEPSQRVVSSNTEASSPEPSLTSLLELPADQLGLDRLDE